MLYFIDINVDTRLMRCYKMYFNVYNLLFGFSFTFSNCNWYRINSLAENINMHAKIYTFNVRIYLCFGS